MPLNWSSIQTPDARAYAGAADPRAGNPGAAHCPAHEHPHKSSDPYAHGDSYRDGNCDSYRDGNRDTHAHPNRHADA